MVDSRCRRIASGATFWRCPWKKHCGPLRCTRGKTLQLAAAGAHVTSVDVSKTRLTRLSENLRRTKLQATLVQADIQTWRPETDAEGVLLDAPCTATGTLRRHPDTAYQKTVNDLKILSSLQRQLLRAAITMVRPGGVVIYCTCSLQKEEGEEQIAALLSETGSVILDPITPQEVGNIEEIITPEGYLRTLPHHLGPQGGWMGFLSHASDVWSTNNAGHEHHCLTFC